jgi:S1-C subfamily serine protease
VRGFGDPLPPKDQPKAKPKSRGGKRAPGAPGDAQAKDQSESKAGPKDMEELSVGTGVVIVDDGVILTNLHVVAGAKRLIVTFHDGSESEATIMSVHPENDLAVIKAQTIPDDLPAATLGSTSRLKPGDEVVAVGFPFGIGPSVSAGVISGLNREFRSPKGDRVLTQLIQFDAAANPGSSGGPLVTMDGDVVGIVTAILNPTEAGTFIGIGFAVTIGVAGRAVGIHPF